jgi:uncharacterized membrane protein YhaH (DUF805 family)
MNMQEAVASVLSQYANFSGRARRSEYWFWTLAVVIVSIIARIIDAIIGVQILSLVVALATLVPGLAVGARRLHDTGRSGWLQLLAIIPIIGWIILIVWFVADSHPDNEYGPNPKGASAAGGFGQTPPPPTV